MNFAVKIEIATGSARLHTVRCRHSASQPGYAVALIVADDVQHAAGKVNATRDLVDAAITLREPCQCITGPRWLDASDLVILRRIAP